MGFVNPGSVLKLEGISRGMDHTSLQLGPLQCCDQNRCASQHATEELFDIQLARNIGMVSQPSLKWMVPLPEVY